MTASGAPRVLLVAQWPSIKNAEYELAERIRHTGFKITVVDFLGFDVLTGRNINDATLCDEYDFALAFHYETPKFLNVPTFLWVANPLEFIQAQGNYRTHLLHHLRSYDDYLYNGSDFLKEHVRFIVGSGWVDGGLAFYQSCSRNALIAPRVPGAGDAASDKLFYCGVNWEAISDKEGRAQGLLEILQERGLADFYGPRSILGVDVWAPYPSYRGEIPFDGYSMFPAMHGYAAVLALSSPAHIKSRTSSGRVLEGFAAGVPVISDDNPHVRGQFGDLVYYFEGETEQQRADSIEAALDEVLSRPDAALERVREAQDLLSTRYCFEVCLEGARDAVVARRRAPAIRPETAAAQQRDKVVDVFLFFHDPYAPDKRAAPGFDNIAHILRAMTAAGSRHGVRFRLLHAQPLERPEAQPAASASEVEWVDVTDAGPADWARLRLGEKLARLAQRSTGDFAVFLTQSDYPQHDYFATALEWFSAAVPEATPALHIAGFYVNDFSAPAPLSAGGIVRNNSSVGLYRWRQDSIAEHQLAQLCFNRAALASLGLDRLRGFDVLLPVAAILDCQNQGMALHRSRHLLLRARHCYYHRYYDAFSRVANKGLWAQQYELLSNASHEIHGLYDVFHEVPAAVAIADRIYGIDIPPSLPAMPQPVHPEVHQVSQFLNQIGPYVIAVKSLGRALDVRNWRLIPGRGRRPS